MIAAAQKVEHYEIAAYGTLRTWANLLGKSDAAAIFEEILEEEKAADTKLTEIAESAVNQEAASEGEEDEEMPSGSRRAASRGSSRQAAADRGRSNRGRK
jgi:hypothetical protein